MTRFKKEMMKRFPWAFEERYDDESTGAYVIEDEALVVFYHPSIVEVIRILTNGQEEEVTNDYPQISAPYLVKLCDGDIERAKQILKSQPSF